MCYSKEVSLIVALIIFAMCGFFYYKYIYKPNYSNKKNINLKHLQPFFNYVLIGSLLVGGHQFSEFLAIATGNEWIYKIGLILSISAMYFYMISLQRLNHFSFYGVFFAPIIIILAVHIFSIPVSFENLKFWVRGHSHIVWAGAWLALYFYWNICVIYVITKSSKLRKKALNWYTLGTLNVTFLLTVIYSFIAISFGNGSFNLAKDGPSIWCTFFVIQLFFIPHMMEKMIKYYKVKIKEPMHHIPINSQIIILLATIVLLVLVYIIFPQFSELAVKFAFK
jgi:hypothetical protein